jgi:quercetin dioxygenase-like cupin family protein
VAGLVTLVAAAALLIAGCGSSSDGAGAGTSTTTTASATTAGSSTTTAAAGAAGPTVVKDILGTVVDPPGADGSTLTLIRYHIPAGAQLAPHVHPGVQIARITAGELTYTVVEGTAIVRRKGATGDEEVTGPATTKLVAGDTVTELDGMVHFGANDTAEEVIIDATLLTKDGKDLAVPVAIPAPATTTTT